jgi:hypothetical protein
MGEAVGALWQDVVAFTTILYDVGLLTAVAEARAVR